MASLEQDSESSNSLWGWFGSIVNWLSSVAEGVEKVWDCIVHLPENIFNFIKSLFIPDADDLQSDITNLSNTFSSAFGVEPVDVSQYLLSDEKSICDDTSTKGDSENDIQADSYLGFDISGISFIDDSWIIVAADKMRPFVRGFIVLLMVFYNVNQLLSFIGAGTLSTLGSDVQSHRQITARNAHYVGKKGG